MKRVTRCDSGGGWQTQQVFIIVLHNGYDCDAIYYEYDCDGGTTFPSSTICYNHGFWTQLRPLLLAYAILSN